MEDNTNTDKNYKGLARAAWIIIGVICLIALIPAVGLLTWFIAIPVLVVTFILGIIAITKGGTLQGVLILLVSLIFAPAYLLVAPMLSTFVFAMVYGDPSEKVADKTELSGEHQTDGGLIYYFNDGVIAVDTSHTPHRYHIYAAHPEGRKVKKVDLIEDGIEVTLPGVNEAVKEAVIGFTGPAVAGKVHVITEELDQNGNLFTQSRHLAIDPGTIKQLLSSEDWNASIRELCGIAPQQLGEDNAAGEEKPGSEPSKGTSLDAEQGDESPEGLFESKLEARPEILMELLADDRDRVEQLLRAAQKKRPTARPWAADVRMLFAADVSAGMRLQGKERVAHYKNALVYLQETHDIA